MTNSRYQLAATSFLLLAGALLPTVARAQTSERELAARRAVILEQNEVITDDGEIIDQNAVRVPAAHATFRSSQTAVPVQEVRWRGRNYGGPYGYYAPRARYYARYPSYYDPYSRGYGYGGYRNYYGTGYGYRGYGYRDYGGYPYGAARVGPLRVFW